MALDDERVQLLRALWATCVQADQRKAFYDSLLDCFHNLTAATIAHALLELKLDSEPGFTWPGPERATPTAFQSFMEAIATKILTEPHLFSTTRLTLLVDLNLRNPLARVVADRSAFRLRDAIDKVKYARLRDELREAVNPELNADRAIVVERAQSAGFGDELRKALSEVEAKLQTASSGFDFKGCMELTRSALEHFVQQTCRKIEPTFGKPLPPPDAGHYKRWLDYVTSAGLLNANDQSLFQILYNYMSNVGAHKLGSAIEEARVTRAMTIELMLLLSGRLKAYLSRPATTRAP